VSLPVVCGLSVQKQKVSLLQLLFLEVERRAVACFFSSMWMGFGLSCLPPRSRVFPSPLSKVFYPLAPRIDCLGPEAVSCSLDDRIIDVHIVSELSSFFPLANPYWQFFSSVAEVYCLFFFEKFCSCCFLFLFLWGLLPLSFKLMTLSLALHFTPCDPMVQLFQMIGISPIPMVPLSIFIHSWVDVPPRFSRL